MIHTDSRFSQAIADRVSAIEQTTDAEIIVVAAPRSATYADLSERAAAVGALVAAIITFYIPAVIPAPQVLIDLVLSWWVVRWLFRQDQLLRPLIGPERLRAETLRAAQSEFVREAVHATPARTGLLVYVSALEATVVVLPDLGLQGAIPAAELDGVGRKLHAHDLDEFLAGLDGLGRLLSKFVPHHGASNETDLPNVPRIRS